MNQTLIALAGAASACLTAPLHAIDFRTLAPAEASTIVVVENFTTLQERMETSGLKAAWDDKRVQEWFETFSMDMMEEFGEDLDRLGIDLKEMKMPEGQVGMANWMDEGEDGEIVSHTLMVADFGESADEMYDMFREAIDRAAADGEIRLDEDDYGDYEILTILPPEEEEADGEEDWDDWEEWDDGGGFGGPLASLFPGGADFEQMYFTRAADVMFVSTTLEGLEAALDRHDGDGDEAIGTRDAFVEARRRLGDNNDVWMVTLVEDELAEQMAAGAGFGTMFADMGIDQIKSVCAGLSMNSPRAMAEMTGFLVSDGKDGILSLLDLEAKPFAPPAFVTPDATEVVAAQFSYERLMDIVMKAMRSAMAEDEGGMVAMMEQQLKMVEPAIRTLGPDTYMAKTIRRPFGPESELSLTAIRTRDARTLAGVIDNLGAMVGLEARDFQGNQIWSMGDAGMLPIEMALGIGSGYLFISTSTEAVENAMRQAVQADALAITEEESFRAATALLDQKGVIYGFSNVKRQLPYLNWLAENMGDVIRQQFRDQMGGGELEPWQEEMIEDMAAASEDAPPMEVLFEYIGNMVYEVRPVEDGYAAKAYILRP